MLSKLLTAVFAVFCFANVAVAQSTQVGETVAPDNEVRHPVQDAAGSEAILPNIAPSLRQPLKGRPGINIGSPNAVKVGGGEGLRLGPPGIGVQYGGGQGIRYGTDRFGVRYGGGEGVRYGTRNIGVQYGGGQLLRWGTPNAGVRVGGGEGVRFGTRRYGVQFGTGFGLQIGRIRSTR